MKRRRRAEMLKATVDSVDPQASVGLQDQIRRRIVDGISLGSLPPGQRLPSSRALARHLGVSRNTVAAAYQQLAAEGHLEARARSGIFVSRTTAPSRRSDRSWPDPSAAEPPVWVRQLGGSRQIEDLVSVLPDWDKYPYPFVGSQLDVSLFPVDEWREAARLTLARAEMEEWAVDAGNADHAMLLREIRNKVLPRRGIHALPDEVLVTGGTQQSLHLCVELLVEPGTTVMVEEPGNPELVALLRRRGAVIRHQPVDAEGLVIDGQLQGCGVVFVSPGHQRPTGVAMSPGRRAALLARAVSDDFVIVEDDFEGEADDLASLPPALRSSPQGSRVAYVATLLQPLSPALRLGVLVAAPSLVRAARALRRIVAAPPPLPIQRTAAHLLALGHYDLIMSRIGEAYRARLLALRDALNHYLVRLIDIPPVRGGTAYWVRGPDHLDVAQLMRAAEARGVLIEPVARCYQAGQAPSNVFRLGVSGIPEERIRPGIEALAKALRSTIRREVGPAGREAYLDAEALQGAMAGATLLCKTVYGDPCTIELGADGTMRGRAGFANEEEDRGRWWVEDDGYWCRQWQEWSYAEAARFRVRIQEDRIEWFKPDGRLVDTGLIKLAPSKS